ncbi:GyrI-like domain-containing protein [Vallitalea okinawensis]|uniref:GyrI-like domain-containing protein n=1 Tax=Vallitalea okinawensis TaxID=2078660 RepID=UPI000CFBE2F0|nr:GyrI-like domain-containing protein [Vallitalea okinawensis]
MATLSKIEFVQFGPYKIVGKEMRTKIVEVNPIYQTEYQTIPSLWQQCFSDGTYDVLLNMRDYIPREISSNFVGYMRDFCEEDGTFTYLVGMFMNTDIPVPEGYSSYDIPAGTIAKAWIEGEEYDIYPNTYRLTVDAVKQNGYDVDWSNYYSCEVYTEQRFGIPKNNGQKTVILDYYLPVIK